MSQDERFNKYRNLCDGQLVAEAPENALSADRILKILFEFARPQSILDVGCGLGVWLQAAQRLGIQELRGIEGPWMDRARLVVDPALVDLRDLEQGFSLDRKFELVICLEVAVHIAPASAQRLVQCLADHADLVLFSAAIPHQGGSHHVNEQFPDYWAALFSPLGFQPLDFIRPRIWTDNSVLWWLRQNVLLFAHERAIAANESLRIEQQTERLLAVVHPVVYLSRLRLAEQMAHKYSTLTSQISQGGTFEVIRFPDGKLSIRQK